MGLLDAALGIMSSGGLGAVTGLIGGWLAKREARKLQADSNAHEAVMAQFHLEEQKLEHTQALEMKDKEMLLAETEGKIVIESKETDAFLASIKNQAKDTGIAIIDGIRGLMRPVITVLLLVATWNIYIKLDEILGGLTILPEDKLTELYMYVVYQVVFLTVLAVSWWFASRGPKNPLGK